MRVVRFNQPLFFFVLLALVAAARLCHVEILWAEETLPSSLAALLVWTVPIWMALLGWLIPGGGRPSWKVGAGLTLGFAGVRRPRGVGTALDHDTAAVRQCLHPFEGKGTRPG